MKKKDETPPKEPLKNPFEDGRFWLAVLLLPVVVFTAQRVYRAVMPPAPPPVQQEQPMPSIRPEIASMRGGTQNSSAPRDPFDVTLQQAEACDFSKWVGKPLYMPSLKKLGRPYTFYYKGTEIAPTGDPQAINIELDGSTVTRVWCG